MTIRLRLRFAALLLIIPVSLFGLSRAHSWGGSTIDTIHALNRLSTLTALDSAPSGSTIENPCPEGEFLDLGASSESGTNVCRPLAKQFGFEQAIFDEIFSHAEFALDSCTEDALRNLLNQARSVGGTVSLPACTIPLSSSMTIPSNVILQGAGIDQTIFEAQAGFTGNMLRSKQDANIIIRDLTVDGAMTDSTGILVWYVDNVLIERVRVHHNGGSGITFRYAQGITIRYSESHDHVEFHGIGSKDCFPNEDNVPDSLECREDAGETAPGTLWSRDYAVYSNRLYNNGDYGIDIHGSSGEVAGNISESNFYGSKFPDASRLWIHHNWMNGNTLWGLRIYNTLEATTRRAGQAIVYQNRFATNGDYPVRFDEPARQIVLIDNVYSMNELNRLRINDVSVYRCPNTTEETIAVDGTPMQVGTDEMCDLASVSTLFPLSSLYVPFSINHP